MDNNRFVSQPFFFTEDTVKEADSPQKGAVIFLHSCDLHAVDRLDEIYLRNGFSDHYYNPLRDKVKLVVMGCPSAFESCFCVDMGTNMAEAYDLSVDVLDGAVYADNREKSWEAAFTQHSLSSLEVVPALSQRPPSLSMFRSSCRWKLWGKWDEYDSRCTACGRCGFVCPACTCFTMQDIFYTDNGRVGERRRVWASCMVDGFTDMAGGHS